MDRIVPRPGEVLVGGRRAAAEAIRAGRARRVLAVRSARETQGLRGLVREARRARVSISWVEPRVLAELRVEDDQGVVATVRLPSELGESDLLAMPFGPDALVVVLDGITDPQNLGACARSAEAAGASVLVERSRRAAPPTAAAVRASAGALLHLPLARVANVRRVLNRLRERGFFVLGLDQSAERHIHEGEPPARPVAVVLGSEDRGLSRLVREGCDDLVAVPMAGRTASLNASAALAVALFGYVMRHRPADLTGAQG